MYLLGFLLVFPAIVAFALLVLKDDAVRSHIVKAAAVLISLATIAFLVDNFHDEFRFYNLGIKSIDTGMFVVEVLLAAYIFYLSLKFKRRMVTLLVVVQTAAMIMLRVTYGNSIVVANDFFVDKLSIVMALIVGILGSAIGLYSIGYMRDYHKAHSDVRDRRGFFFFIIFVFLSAMFGLVLSNNLLWIFFFWEITTLSSFFLIGYSRTEEATWNAFCALEYNLWGGIAFILAIYYSYSFFRIAELDRLMLMGGMGGLIPVALICFAGITKSAQYPFSKWLLGAMVAPTPVSALLHSSTMVKAGVYIILRFAMVLDNLAIGYVVAAIGGLTFLIGSAIAVSQHDAKKVLAYSTIANLGLIVLCGGIGTYEAMWAAILLIVFHAVTKCLLFLCVGVVDSEMHTRDIEDMTSLITRMPRVSVMMQIGMAGMFLAPFGMLISKWAVIKALVDSNPILLLFVVFGGSATVFYWVKWMGKMIMVVEPERDVEIGVGGEMWIPLYTLTVLTVLFVGFLPLLSKFLIVPYIIEIYDRTITMSHGNIFIMLVMMGLILAFPLAVINYGKGARIVSPYICGANAEGGVAFTGAFGRKREMEMKDYYIDRYFGEALLSRVGFDASFVLILAMFVLAVL